LPKYEVEQALNRMVQGKLDGDNYNLTKEIRNESLSLEDCGQDESCLYSCGNFNSRTNSLLIRVDFLLC
jgi:hypothetical protein